jgi:steroid 5-alpha reductase family enzyme
VNPWCALPIVWLLAMPMMTLGWQWQRRHVNAGIVDVLWATGLAGSAVLIALLGRGAPAPRMVLAVLGGTWGVRLALHLWSRVRREDEDGRYRALRERWQGDQLRFFALFQFQALLIPLFALPFVAVAATPETHSFALAMSVAIWLLAVSGETLADAQLARFRADPAHRGKTCRIGLWRYSRHPNYFCEWLHWFAYVLLAWGSPLAWLAWSGPVLMYLFLRFLSGVPFTEAQALHSRGEDYRDYQRRTSMFFPWFPKSSRTRE